MALAGQSGLSTPMTTMDLERVKTRQTPKIIPFDESKSEAWDTFVRTQSEGTLFHLTAWKRAIERAFGFVSRYLLAEDQGQIRGVLPLFLSSNWVQGRTLISTPFAVYGGICSDDPKARLALREAARQMAVKEGVNYLELREAYHAFGDGFLTKELYVTFEQELPADPEKLLKGFPKDTRYMIRKGQKGGLRSVNDKTYLDTFYDIYAASVRNLGTPVFSKMFFRILLEEFGDAAEVLTIWNGEDALAAVLSFRFRDTILPYYGGSLLEGRKFAANNFMYWEVFRSACERGLKTFDFGRSKLGTGSYFFKTQWNMRERPLPYQFFLVRRKDLPNFSPVNPKFKLATDIWKRIPLPLTKMLGPALVRLFP
jgi:FemAB-related protein (PEP-CTERM system-associated)